MRNELSSIVVVPRVIDDFHTADSDPLIYNGDQTRSCDERSVKIEDMKRSHAAGVSSTLAERAKLLERHNSCAERRPGNVATLHLINYNAYRVPGHEFMSIATKSGIWRAIPKRVSRHDTLPVFEY
uniref:Uncharacterized protein n=1 Tax=Pristionchus pacificus TaxID=54126 RepID=A0A2A6BWP7_PRIPA|eukprot:PDM70344.1 hypothetical protein PRIPAC_46590 [Pristionchus pacificus]